MTNLYALSYLDWDDTASGVLAVSTDIDKLKARAVVAERDARHLEDDQPLPQPVRWIAHHGSETDLLWENADDGQGVDYVIELVPVI